MSHHPSFKRRTVFAVAGLTASALALTACGREAGDAGAGAAASAKPISEGKATGELTVWALGAEGEKLPALVKEFEAANPGAKVKVTAVPWDAAHDKFASAITAGQTPDAAMVGTTWMGEFAGMDALDPTPEGIDKASFFEGAQKTTEVDGTAYGIPWYVETRLVYYRTDLAAKAGITEPRRTGTASRRWPRPCRTRPARSSASSSSSCATAGSRRTASTPRPGACSR